MDAVSRKTRKFNSAKIRTLTVGGVSTLEAIVLGEKKNKNT